MVMNLHFLEQRRSDLTVLTCTGHGGKCCAEYISKTLPQVIATHLTKNEDIPVAERITVAFEEADDALIKDLHNSFKQFLAWPMPKSVKKKMIDSKLQQPGLQEIILRARSCTTALVVLIENHCFTLANVGNCRAGTVLDTLYDSKFIVLTFVYCSPRQHIPLGRHTRSKSIDSRSKWQQLKGIHTNCQCTFCERVANSLR